jgi:hypothetical protein
MTRITWSKTYIIGVLVSSLVILLGVGVFALMRLRFSNHAITTTNTQSSSTDDRFIHAVAYSPLMSVDETKFTPTQYVRSLDTDQSNWRQSTHFQIRGVLTRFDKANRTITMQVGKDLIDVDLGDSNTYRTACYSGMRVGSDGNQIHVSQLNLFISDIEKEGSIVTWSQLSSLLKVGSELTVLADRLDSVLLAQLIIGYECTIK